MWPSRVHPGPWKPWRCFHFLQSVIFKALNGLEFFSCAWKPLIVTAIISGYVFSREFKLFVVDFKFSPCRPCCHHLTAPHKISSSALRTKLELLDFWASVLQDASCNRHCLHCAFAGLDDMKTKKLRWTQGMTVGRVRKVKSRFIKMSTNL